MANAKEPTPPSVQDALHHAADQGWNLMNQSTLVGEERKPESIARTWLFSARYVRRIATYCDQSRIDSGRPETDIVGLA
jgi:hypothetical protein